MPVWEEMCCGLKSTFSSSLTFRAPLTVLDPGASGRHLSQMVHSTLSPSTTRHRPILLLIFYPFHIFTVLLWLSSSFHYSQPLLTSFCFPFLSGLKPFWLKCYEIFFMYCFRSLFFSLFFFSSVQLFSDFFNMWYLFFSPFNIRRQSVHHESREEIFYHLSFCGVISFIMHVRPCTFSSLLFYPQSLRNAE